MACSNNSILVIDYGPSYGQYVQSPGGVYFVPAPGSDWEGPPVPIDYLSDEPTQIQVNEQSVSVATYMYITPNGSASVEDQTFTALQPVNTCYDDDLSAESCSTLGLGSYYQAPFLASNCPSPVSGVDQCSGASNLSLSSSLSGQPESLRKRMEKHHIHSKFPLFLVGIVALIIAAIVTSIKWKK